MKPARQEAEEPSLIDRPVDWMETHGAVKTRIKRPSVVLCRF